MPSLIRGCLDPVQDYPLHFFCCGVQMDAIYPQKHVAGCKRCPFIAICKRMVHQQAFEKRTGFLDDVVVIAALRTENSGLNSPHVAHAVRAAIFFDEGGMDAEDISRG